MVDRKDTHAWHIELPRLWGKVFFTHACSYPENKTVRLSLVSMRF